MDPQNMKLDLNASTAAPLTPTSEPEKGAIGIAFLVWLFGGGLGLAILIFVLLKVF